MIPLVGWLITGAKAVFGALQALKINTWDKWSATTRLIAVLVTVILVLGALVAGLLWWNSEIDKKRIEAEGNTNLERGLSNVRVIEERKRNVDINANQATKRREEIEANPDKNVSVPAANMNRCRAFPDRPECKK